MVEQVRGLGLAELQGYGQEWESHSFLPQGQLLPSCFPRFVSSLAWLSTSLGHAGCCFFLLSLLESDSGSWEANNFYSFFEDALLVYEIV